MDAINMLKEDHERVNKLFKQLNASSDDARKRKVFHEIKQELDAHTRLEENIFYPACQKYDELRDMILEAIEEHKQVKTLLRDIGQTEKMNEHIEAKLTVLQENVEHHVEEEEKDLFPMVRKVMKAQELQQITDQLVKAKGLKTRGASAT